MFKGTSTITCNSTITNSTIITSSIATSTMTTSTITATTINMSSGVITNGGTPVNPTDVPNKLYVDTLIQAYNTTVSVTLTGTNKSTIISNTSGDYEISIRNIVTGGPTARFSVTKNDPSQQPSITRFNSKAGLTTLERLLIQWNPNTGLQLFKNGTNYDGIYTVKLNVNY